MTWAYLWLSVRNFSLSGAVGGQTLACNVQLAQHGETHPYFILAHGKSRAIDSTLFLLLCKQQRTQSTQVEAKASIKEKCLTKDGILRAFQWLAMTRHETVNVHILLRKESKGAERGNFCLFLSTRCLKVFSIVNIFSFCTVLAIAIGEKCSATHAFLPVM